MPLSELERQLFFWLHGYDIPVINDLMFFFSGFLPWLPLATLLLWNMWNRFSRFDFFKIVVLCLLLLAMTDTSTSYFFKNLIQRLRPCKMSELQPMMTSFGRGCGGKWGFFSSHAANSAALVFFLTKVTTPKPWTCYLAWGVVFFVSYSRIYLGVHLPLDIMAGVAWGILVSWPWSWVGKMSTTEPTSP